MVDRILKSILTVTIFSGLFFACCAMEQRECWRDQSLKTIGEEEHKGYPSLSSVCLRFAFDGKSIVSYVSVRCAKDCEIWNLESGSRVKKFSFEVGNVFANSVFLYVAREGNLIVLVNCKSVTFFDRSSKEFTECFGSKNDQNESVRIVPEGRGVLVACVSSDGKYIAYGSDAAFMSHNMVVNRQMIEILELKSKKTIKLIEIKSEAYKEIVAICFSSDTTNIFAMFET
jgi:hypothetical protein